MELKSIVTAMFLLAAPCSPVRLHKLFQFIDGYRSEHNHKGFLHIGNEYSVFLLTPIPHAKYLVYELYESQNVNHSSSYKPTLLSVSKIPVEYIKEQLMLFRDELQNAKYVDKNAIPGTQVKTLREWQIEKALGLQNEDLVLKQKPAYLRTLM
ncbi:uncharacterized protein [Choristoneura fumiferana]|uniref:uncharacterized protein n=1 Tax=Choristoneura fumiferana TaxID=7141 RepID=UPI003D156241